jgi:hypothetical protein
MKYGIVHHFPGGTKAQYDAVLKPCMQRTSCRKGNSSMQANRPWLDGHCGSRLKESWERFRDTILMPRLKQGISGGFTTPPQEKTFEVHNLMP